MKNKQWKPRWHYLDWHPPWECEPGYFLLRFETDEELGFHYFFLLGFRWIKPTEEDPK